MIDLEKVIITEDTAQTYVFREGGFDRQKY